MNKISDVPCAKLEGTRLEDTRYISAFVETNSHLK